MQIKFIDRQSGEIKAEHPPAEGLLRFLYDNPFGAKAILPFAKRKLISEWYGRKMNSPKSVNKIQSFIDELGIDMTEYQKQINEFTSFNDFFYRKLKPNAREIQEGLVSPGDGKVLAFNNISDVNEFFVKGRKFTLKEFIVDDNLVEKYQDAGMIILRLAPNDYHRYHFPYNGTASESKEIKGNYFSVSPIALARNFTKVFCENKRELCELSTQKDDILIVPVGAAMVGSIISTYKTNQPIKKGAEMGYFAFGGSTIVLFFNTSQFKIDEDLIENTKNKMETFVRMGEKIAK